MFVCKNDCDFTEWINKTSTDDQIVSLAKIFLPYMKSSSKKVKLSFWNLHEKNFITLFLFSYVSARESKTPLDHPY